MSLTALPLDVFSLIIDYVVAISPISESLPLRTVNTSFQYAVNGAFFERQVRNDSYSYADDRAGERMTYSDTFRYVHGHLHPYLRNHPFAVELGDAASIILARDELVRPVIATCFPDCLTLLGDSRPEVQDVLRRMVTSVISDAVVEYLKHDTTNILHVFGYQISWVPRYGSWSWTVITMTSIADLPAVRAILEMEGTTREYVLFHCLRAAAIKGNVQIANLALEQGASIDLPSHSLQKPLSGSTILEDACKSAHYNIVSLLLTNGINDDPETLIYNKAITCAAHPFPSDDEAKIDERIRIIDLLISQVRLSHRASLRRDAMSAAVGRESIKIMNHMLASANLSFYAPNGVDVAGWVTAAVRARNGDFIVAAIRQVIASRRSSTSTSTTTTTTSSSSNTPEIDQILTVLSTWRSNADLLYIWETLAREDVQGDVQLKQFFFTYACKGPHLDLLSAACISGYSRDQPLCDTR